MKSIDGNHKKLKVSSNIIQFGESFFYSRVFYELPVPALLIDAAEGNIIVDINKQAAKALNMPASSIINRKISNSYFTKLNNYDSSGQLVFEKNGNIIEKNKPISIDNKKINFLEILSTSEFTVNQKKYLILILNKKNTCETDEIETTDYELIDNITGLPNKLAAKYELEIFGFGGHNYTRIYIAAIFSIENLDSTNISNNRLFKLLGIELKKFSCAEVFISRHSYNSFLVIIHSRKEYMNVLESIYKALTNTASVFYDNNEQFLLVRVGAYAWCVWDSVNPEDILLKVTDAHNSALLKKDSSWVFFNEFKKYDYNEGTNDRKVADIFRKKHFKLYFKKINKFNNKKADCALAIFKLESCDNNEHSTYKSEENTLWEIDILLDMVDNWFKSGIEINIFLEIEESCIHNSDFRIKLLSICKNYSKKSLQLLHLSIVKGPSFDYEKIRNSIEKFSCCYINFSLDCLNITEFEKIIDKELPVSSVHINTEPENILFEDIDSIRRIKKTIDISSHKNIKIYLKKANDIEYSPLLKFIGFSGVEQYPCSKLIDEDDFFSQSMIMDSVIKENIKNPTLIKDLIKPKLEHLKFLLTEFIEKNEKPSLLKVIIDFLFQLKILLIKKVRPSLEQINIIESIDSLAKDIHYINNNSKNTAKIVLLTSKAVNLLENLIDI